MYASFSQPIFPSLLQPPLAEKKKKVDAFKFCNTKRHPIGQNSPTQLKINSKVQIFEPFHSREAQNLKRVGVELHKKKIKKLA